MSKPRLYVLVGVPGAGKSTWVAAQDWAKECALISTDAHVEAHARAVGKTYAEVFAEFMPFAVREMVNDVYSARAAGKDIIWDQTSTTAKTRAKKLAMLPDYYSIAVVFKTPPAGELQHRLNSRPGKSIPEDVIKQMIEQFEEPTVEEGFEEIWYCD